MTVLSGINFDRSVNDNNVNVNDCAFMPAAAASSSSTSLTTSKSIMNTSSSSASGPITMIEHITPPSPSASSSGSGSGSLDDQSDADTISGGSGQQNDDGIILKEIFYINNNHHRRKHNLKIQVQLNATGIYLRRETSDSDHVTEQLIRMEDIIGSHCGTKVKRRARGGLTSCKRIDDYEDEQHQQQQQQQQQEVNGSVTSLSQDHKDISAYLYVYAYVKKEKPLRRMRTVRILRFRSFLTYEENLKSARQWHNAIKMNRGQDPADVERKPLLILLNPKSGSGKGRVMFQKQVAPIFKEADIQYDLVVTTHANFARELVRSRKDLVQRYRGIVVASGDGLFYEVLNGMMEREDWKVLSHRLPLGIIPCGSGNGLAKSIAHLYNEPYEPKPIVNATLSCVSGHFAPLDVVRVQLSTKQGQVEMYSFLSVGWGLIADIDIESEKLRSIGAPRFTLWSIHRILRLRSYKGKLSYLPWKKKEVHKEFLPQGGRRHSSNVRKFQDPHDDDEEGGGGKDQFNDAYDGEGDEDDAFVDVNSFKHFKTDSWHSAASRGTAYYSIAGHSMRSNKSTATIMSRIEAANAEFNTKAPQSSIPALGEPLTDEWISEESEFTMVHAAYTTHLATDCHFAPDSKLNDGIIYLVIIRKGISKSQLIQFLLNLSHGTHLSEAPSSYVQVVPVSAFRIEPQANDGGIITVDGEKVDYGSVQGEIFPGMIRAMVPSNNCGGGGGGGGGRGGDGVEVTEL